MNDRTQPSGPVVEVETAMVAIRRRQTRRTFARTAAAEHPNRVSETGALFGILDLLDGAHRPVAMSEVIGMLDIDQPRASKLVTQGVGRGLIRRHADQQDGRRSLLTLTESGASVVEHAHRDRRSRFAAAMATWTDKERAEFADLLTRFVVGLGSADH